MKITNHENDTKNNTTKGMYAQERTLSASGTQNMKEHLQLTTGSYNNGTSVHDRLSPGYFGGVSILPMDERLGNSDIKM